MPAKSPSPDDQHRHVHLQEHIRAFTKTAQAPNTSRAYRADWDHFVLWCALANRSPMPADPQTVAMYLSDLATSTLADEDPRKVSTIRRRLTTIRKAHAYHGHPNPTLDPLVEDVFDGIRREIGFLQEGKQPILLEELRAMVNALPETIAGVRDRAVLLLGFSGCFRRSELVSLDISDLQYRTEGMIVRLRKSKTDQFGTGYQKGIPHGQYPDTCPVRAVQAWVRAIGESRGPLFRRVSKGQKILSPRLTDHAVAIIVKNAALLAGLDPDRFSGHSLRAGFATQAAMSGASERAIVRQGAWMSEKMARRYIRDASLFTENAVMNIGL